MLTKFRNPLTLQYVRAASYVRKTNLKEENINSNLLIVEKTNNPKQIPDNKFNGFGRTFTDHLLSVDWTEKYGWQPSRLFIMDPGYSTFHYGLQAFSGNILTVTMK